MYLFHKNKDGGNGIVFEGKKKESIKNNQEWIGNVLQKPSLGDSVRNPESSLLLALLQVIFIFLAIIRAVRAFNLISDIQY